MVERILRSGEGGIRAMVAIIAVSSLLGILAGWRAPGIDRYARDLLVQTRGALPAPDDIAIVAIDERSMARFGRFPWSRSIMARTIDKLADGHPKAIALDVLYTDASSAAEDSALARAVAKAGNVVAAAQLTEPAVSGGPSVWLMPLPEIAVAAAAIGHVNVLTESDGVGRAVLIRAADDAGRAFIALPVEAVRVGDRLPEQAVVDNGRAVLIGTRVIPVSFSHAVVLTSGRTGSAEHMRAQRMAIDYVGPAGSFASTTYSLADVAEGRVQSAVFHGKYVLVGATAGSMGDRLASPFMHQTDAQANQHGSLMPGVEVLANALNTILRSRFYAEVPDWAAGFWAAVIAGATLALLALSQGRGQAVRQVAALAGLACAILLVSYLVFTRMLVYPPITSSMVSFASAGLLGLLHRSLITSARLDQAITEMTEADDLFAPAGNLSAAETVRGLNVPAAAIFAPAGGGRYRLVSSHGMALAPGLDRRRLISPAWKTIKASEIFSLPGDSAAKYELLVQPLGNAREEGRMVILHLAGQPPPLDALRLYTAIAEGFLVAGAGETTAPSSWLWPRGLEAKARAIQRLNSRMLERTRFVDSALRAVEDGLIIAAPDGRIHFANRRAAAILGSNESAMIGSDLLERIAENERGARDGEAPARETLARLLLDRVPVEREITIRGSRPRQYTLRVAAVPSHPDAGPVLGIVASLSDITRQKELQQTKNDVIALVSHEMRTPLTAIQGMSEVLAKYDVDTERRREMNLAINEEVKRLTRMITEYLDITRLESGATTIRRSAVRLESLAERTLLLLEPIASQRGIRITRQFAAGIPPVIGDSDLLSRAIENLVSNAIKYSPDGTEIAVRIRRTDAGVALQVSDQGFGIAAADLNRIFEKFYRVPRVQDADVPGTGLGLALVREITELHGGGVTVDSEVGVGSTFEINIPIGRAGEAGGAGQGHC